ncbi:MAG: NTP transferase domain-containing protein [Planctomycetaceae bacterium]|nr:NTP transferase domain-containing protein [Planctomycetaceae bacterium]
MDFAVIMAGGSGKRLWPLSRQKRPKQVLRLLDGQTLLRKCFERLQGLFDLRNILVLTNAEFVDVVQENLAELPKQNVIAEPVIRDTAGAIGLAAAVLYKYDRAATMAVVTADQLLEPAEVFHTAMRSAISFVNQHPNALVTFGIKPTYPATELGYLRLSKSAERAPHSAVHRVEAFKEKPGLATAQSYVDSGDYFWNSGMFVWHCQTILEQLKRFLPASTEPLQKIQSAWGGPEQQQVLCEWFPKLPKISIDFAVMEKAEHVYGLPLDCRWLDMGSFAALADVITADANNNIVVAGASELLDCRDSIIITEENDHLLALVGVKNVIVAHTRDATLVCPVEQGHRLKDLLEEIRKHHQGKYL